jgi:hypothetical protein
MPWSGYQCDHHSLCANEACLHKQPHRPKHSGIFLNGRYLDCSSPRGWCPGARDYVKCDRITEKIGVPA